MMVHADVDAKGDALVRAWRTFGQGATIAALVGLGSYLTTLDGTTDWGNVGMAALQAVATAVVTYAHNKMRPAV